LHVIIDCLECGASLKTFNEDALVQTQEDAPNDRTAINRDELRQDCLHGLDDARFEIRRGIIVLEGYEGNGSDGTLSIKPAPRHEVQGQNLRVHQLAKVADEWLLQNARFEQRNLNREPADYECNGKSDARLSHPIQPIQGLSSLEFGAGWPSSDVLPAQNRHSGSADGNLRARNARPLSSKK
jgi:hypothetical protein